VDYAGDRSNGCTSWSRSDAGQIIAMVKDNPPTLYIYPDSADIGAVARAVTAGRSLSGAGLYWNASCLKKSALPNFGRGKLSSRSSLNTRRIIGHRHNGRYRLIGAMNKASRWAEIPLIALANPKMSSAKVRSLSVTSQGPYVCVCDACAEHGSTSMPSSNGTMKLQSWRDR